MALHFEETEFAARRDKLSAALQAQGLDGILIFAQESMYWLTGYDTFGFCFFQCLFYGTDGRMALLTRSADLRQAQHTSNIQDLRIWTDQAGATPAGQLRDMLDDLGQRGRRLGIETDTHGLTYRNGKAVEAAMEGFASLTDASDIITRLRAVKSPAEIAYVRKAAELGDAALAAAQAIAGPGVDEGEILAAQQAAIFAGGGDYPANEFIIGSGPDALLCRYKAGRRVLSANDQLTLEFAGVYRHYHAALMRTFVIGEPSRRHVELQTAAVEALAAVEDALRPGKTAGDVFEAHRAVMDAHGLQKHRLNACGYSLGAKFTPSWMDWPMFYAGNPWVLEPDMVMFTHMIIMDSDAGAALCLGRTSLVTQSGSAPLSRASLDLVVK
ncbi:MAG: aminopeptidase P family protein [Rhodobiaceae bacterium]|nr:aminopeptidase P family protein [Rhodobiaceae bacterium]MCC0042505.1 aminopeptidase P family protein [Rhodobiaceae bacterium]MCC0053452.1 aminopeptidase P family protein [Rhodobiaceae bacterium]